MLVFLVALNILLGLWLESSGFPWAMLFVNFATWTHFAFYFWPGSRRRRFEMCLCLVLATLGELFLSEVWQVYSYRGGSLPLFVPPGHVLLYLAGVTIAEKLEKVSLGSRTLGEWLVNFVPVLVLGFNIALWTHGLDTNGMIWFSIFLFCLWKGRDRVLYVTMFLLALSMEVYGTGMGSWVWESRVPWLGLTSLNPPVCAGVFYCLLDMLVMKGAVSTSFQTGQKKTS